LDAYDWRLPGGKVVDTLDEYLSILDSWIAIEPFVLEAASKEAQEEIGLQIIDQEIFTKKICGATMEWDLWYVLVSDFNWLESWRNEEDGEIIDGHQRFSYEEIKDMIADSSIQEWRTAAVLAQIVLL
jgi:8-oxo-dGTP pyrophosphatase MutT (NUDIX family)